MRSGTATTQGKRKSFHPRPGCLLVRKLEKKKMTDTGLYLPESGQEDPDEAEVLANGLGTGEYQPGASVYLEKYAGYQIVLNGEKLSIVKLDSVLGEIKWE